MTEQGQAMARQIEAEWRDLQRTWIALAGELDSRTRQQLEIRLWQTLTHRMDLTNRSIDESLRLARRALAETQPFTLDTD